MRQSEYTSDNPRHPYFSVILLLWNNSAYLQRCLESLSSQTFRDFEIILVDNGSPETVSREILDQFTDLVIKVYRCEKNIGFAQGNNTGASLASGQYLALLNIDAFPESEWLNQVYQAANKYPNTFFASKLIMANSPDRLDGEGDVYHISGLAWRNSYNALAYKKCTSEGQVFSACGAAAIYPRELFTLVGGFDPDYFAYIEDIDLGFRMRLAGYKCIYLPEAVVYHIGSGSTSYQSPLSIYYGQRNLVWTFFKDMPALLLIILLPLHILMNILYIITGITRGRGTTVIRAKIDAIKGLPGILNKRKFTHLYRKASMNELLAAMDTNPFSPLFLYLQKSH